MLAGVVANCIESAKTKMAEFGKEQDSKEKDNSQVEMEGSFANSEASQQT